ncbi:hypothetical protein D9M68_961040 [compost metagenome]
MPRASTPKCEGASTARSRYSTWVSGWAARHAATVSAVSWREVEPAARMLESMWSSFMSVNHFLCKVSALRSGRRWENSIFDVSG